jgi:hypothetical protein
VTKSASPGATTERYRRWLTSAHTFIASSNIIHYESPARTLVLPSPPPPRLALPGWVASQEADAIASTLSAAAVPSPIHLGARQATLLSFQRSVTER